MPHLSYVGDATIGRGANIGAATVFVNYDGVAKHRTTSATTCGSGSDTMLVAPVTVGDGAYTAAGSVITADVPAGGHGRRAGAPAECGRLGATPASGVARGRGRGSGRAAGGRLDQTGPRRRGRRAVGTASR